jgi:hypothetical protein
MDSTDDADSDTGDSDRAQADEVNVVNHDMGFGSDSEDGEIADDESSADGDSTDTDDEAYVPDACDRDR